MNIDEKFTKEICKQLKEYQGKRKKAFLALTFLCIIALSLGFQISPRTEPLYTKITLMILAITFIIIMMRIYFTKINLDLKNHMIIFIVNKNLFKSKVFQYSYILGMFILLFCLFSLIFFIKHKNVFMVIPPASIYSLFAGMAALIIFKYHSYPIYLLFRSDFLILSLETETIYSSKAKSLGSIDEYLHLNTAKQEDIVADLHKYGFSIYDSDDEDETTMSEVILLKKKNEFKKIYMAPHHLRSKLK